MLHEQFLRWLSTLHKIVLAHHDEDCTCECGFCLHCQELETLSIGWLMRHILCPPEYRFPSSKIKLFDWKCIADEWVLSYIIVHSLILFPWYDHFCFPLPQMRALPFQQLGDSFSVSIFCTSIRFWWNWISGLRNRRSHWETSCTSRNWCHYARCHSFFYLFFSTTHSTFSFTNHTLHDYKCRCSSQSQTWSWMGHKKGNQTFFLQTNVLNDALLLPSSPNRFGTARWPQNVVGSDYRGLLPFGSGCWLCTKLWTHISGLYRPPPPPPFPPIHIVTFHFSNWCVEHFSPFKS